MVGMYANLSEIDTAQTVFDSLPARDVVSWNLEQIDHWVYAERNCQ
jgi:hypothetical protein